MQIKPNIKRARIDVGLSATAPYSAYWLQKYSDMLVLGFEPSPHNMKAIIDGLEWVKDSPYLDVRNGLVKLNGEGICNYEEKGNQFIPYEFAVDNVDNIEQKTFYCTSKLNSGCSSLYKPIEERLNGVTIENEVKVLAASLSSFLYDFPYEQIPIIDFLKTDTQGNDLNVIKSCGEHLKNICFVQCEWNTNGAYEETNENWMDLLQYMGRKNFTPYYHSSTDAAFVNNELIPYIIEHGIMNDGFENQNGTNFIL